MYIYTYAYRVWEWGVRLREERPRPTVQVPNRRSGDVCKGSRSSVEGERCIVRISLLKRLEVNEEEDVPNHQRLP
jgi:hypothetical protein